MGSLRSPHISLRTTSLIAVALAAMLSSPAPSHAAVNAQTGGVCDRTEAVREALVDLVDDVHPDVAGCADVTDAHLAAITGVLDLRYSNIHSLRVGDFDGLSQLERLEIGNNQLRSLPAGLFDGLVSLVNLDLKKTEMRTLPDGIFDGLDALTSLDLEFGELRTLPTGVFAGLDLTFLGLEANSLRTLEPGVFDDLSVSLTLDLSHNELRTLPAGLFSDLDTLGLLDLSVNELDALPPGLFSGLNSLTQLWLSGNPVSQFGFTMTPRRVSGTNKLVVAVDKAAPFAMSTTLTVTGGDPSDRNFAVTVPAGSTASGETTMTSLEGATATLSGLPPHNRRAFQSMRVRLSEPVVFFDTSSGTVSITSDPGSRVPGSGVRGGEGLE